MAIYRPIFPTFWSDTKVTENFTPEDKLFYLYLLTNPYTNLIGCYELSMKKAAQETGYNTDTIGYLLNRMAESHKVIEYDKNTSEVLVLNWSKYNWSKSPKLDKAIEGFLDKVKSNSFRDFVAEIYNRRESVSIPYQYPMDTTVTVSVTVPVTDKERIVKERNVFEDFTDNQELIETLNQFVLFRKKIKAPMTDYAIELMLKKLIKFGNDDQERIEILNQSIMKGYKGLFPLNNSTKVKSTTAKIDDRSRFGNMG